MSFRPWPKIIGVPPPITDTGLVCIDTGLSTTSVSTLAGLRTAPRFSKLRHGALVGLSENVFDPDFFILSCGTALTSTTKSARESSKITVYFFVYLMCDPHIQYVAIQGLPSPSASQ